MKKRLLSAALALVMVLTMLPLSMLPAFADDPKPSDLTGTGTGQLTENGVNVRSVKKGAVLRNKMTIDNVEYEALTAPADGWYAIGKQPQISVSNAASVYYVNGGVLAGTTWYSNVGNALDAKKTSITLQENGSINLTMSPTTVTSLTIDLNGYTLSGSITLPKEYVDANSKTQVAPAISQLNIKDSAYPSNGKNYNDNQSSLSISADADRKNTTAVKLDNVNIGAIDLKSENGSSVTLTSAKATTIQINNSGTSGNSGTVKLAKASECTSISVTAANMALAGNTVQVDGVSTVTGAVSLSGKSGGAVNVGASGDNARSKVQGGVTISTTAPTSTNTTVKAVNAEITNVTLTGVGASLSADYSTLGDVKVIGYVGTDLTDSQKNGKAPSITLNNSKADSIAVNTTAGTEALNSEYTVKLNSNSDGGAITLPVADIQITNAKAGVIDLDSGKLTITGSSSGPASTDTLALGDTGKAVAFKVVGTNVTTGDITTTGTHVTAEIPASETNTFGTTGAVPVFANRGIAGGVFSGEVNAANMVNTGASALRYEVKRGANEFVYYARTQLQKLIDEYGKYASTVPAFAIRIVGDGTNGTDQRIILKNGDKVLTEIVYQNSDQQIPLPGSVNGGAVAKWMEYAATKETVDGVQVWTEGDLLDELAATATYSTPAEPANIILNAQVTDSTVTKLEGALSATDGVTARLNGNVITLSGAVSGNGASIKVNVITDNGIEEEVSIVYDDGAVRFSNQNATLKGGMRIVDSYNALEMPNGVRYTLNGTGLKAQATKLDDSQIIGYTQPCPVIVTVNVNGNGWTNASKLALAKAMTNDDWSTNNAILTITNGESYVDFSDSPAVKEALNAVVAKITDSQINSWVTAVQNASWRKAGNTGTASEIQRANTGYNKVYVVAYMAVNIRNYNTANKPGTLTMELVPSYYVEVRRDSGAAEGLPLDPTVASEQRLLRPQSGTLGTLTGEIGTIELKMTKEGTFLVDNAVAHQGDTYAYLVSRDTPPVGIDFEITGKVNNALGTFIINGDAPMVTLYDARGNYPGSAKAYYDTLQAAVDATDKDGQFIVVDANYKGSTQVTMTGKSRTITVYTGGDNTVSSNATGTVVTPNTAGTEFELQLKNDVTTPTTTTTATITTQSTEYGVVRASVSSAKSGDRVTITTTAYNGYQTNTPIVRTNTGASVPVAAASNSNTTTTAQWTFTVPNGATSITITPSFTLSAIPFVDVRSDAWYYNGVAYCYNNKLMQGEASTIFSPNGRLARREVAEVLYRLDGGTPETPKVTFTDVSTGDWAYNAIVWCANRGYINGMGDGTFKPTDPVTREQLAQMLYNYAGKPKVNYSLAGNYTDGGKVMPWFNDAMSWAAYYNILSGTNSVNMNGYLYGDTVAMRSEIAVTLMKYLQRYPK